MTTVASRPLRLLFRDEHLVVADKPAGLAVHRGWAPERDVAMTRVRDAVGAHVFPVHRLDRGTSGTLVFALSAEIAAALSQLFVTREVEKTYLALVRSIPPESGIIDHPLPHGEHRNDARLPARTAFFRLEVFGRYSLVELHPESGRLHQIRRHMKHLACPIIGDVRYGKGEHNRLFRTHFDLHRMFLHATRIQFPHPITGGLVDVHAPLPVELAVTLARLRAEGCPSLEESASPVDENHVLVLKSGIPTLQPTKES
jgi:tRNA pseudouridine65 synthase